MNSPLVYLTGVFVLGIAAQWIAWRLRLPAILLLLGVGFASGFWAKPTDVIDERLLFPIVSLSVAVILFDGGLSLRLSDLRETRRVVMQLIFIGGFITFILSTLAARMVFTHSGIAALAGAIYVVTGPTVIIPLLRQIRPLRRIGSVAKWEGIVNDPIGAMLAVLVFEVVAAGAANEAAFSVVMTVVKTVAVSTVFGVLAAAFLVILLKRHWVPDYLHNPVLFATVLGAYTASNLLQTESGLATVTLLGVLLANQKQVKISHLIEFKENLGVLLVSALFILLAARLRPERLMALGWEGVAFLAVSILAIRPAAVFLSTIRTGLSWKERLFLAWLAPRGIVAAAVSSVFALELVRLAAERNFAPEVVEQARLLVPLTFLLIVGTVFVYGLSAAPLTRWLQVADASPQGILFAGAEPFVRSMAQVIHAEGFQVLLVDTNYDRISAARMAGLPAEKASVLSEYVRNEIDLGGIGRLLAVTSNNEVNMLTCLHFVEVFGRANVYQLPSGSQRAHDRQAATTQFQGRTLFGPDITHEYLAKRFAEGAVVKKTQLTPEFDYESFRSEYGETAVALFVLTPARKLKIWTGEESSPPPAGSTLISLVNPPQKETASQREKQPRTAESR